MSSALPQTQFEGNWEDIVRKGDQFAGKRVRVTLLSEDDPHTLRQSADRLMAEIESLEPDADRPKLRERAAEYAEAVAKKLRDQGIQS